VRHKHGLWLCRIAEVKHLNYKELRNLVEAIENWAKDEGEHCLGTTLFMFTNNIVAERAYFCSNSKSRELFKLVYRLEIPTNRYGV